MRRLLVFVEHESEAWTIPDAALESLARDVPDLDITRARSRDAFMNAIADAEIVFSWAPGDDAMARADRLRWIHAPATGIGSYLTPHVLRRPVVLTSSRGVHAVPIAEHVVGMLVAMARRFREAVVEQTTTGMRRERWWVGRSVPGELYGKTLGLFGYGSIGREVARRSLAMGMRVLALRRDPGRADPLDPEMLAVVGLPVEDPDPVELIGPADLPRLLAESDAIVVAAALTDETQGRFDEAAFSAIKPGAWFVNVARGRIVREEALIAALRDGRVAGAALDVFEKEPLPKESPLYSLENVILTPHVSGLSRGFWPRTLALFRANLARDAAGLPLWNRVDRARGY